MNTTTFQSVEASSVITPHKNGRALSRLISAAVVNRNFCNLLLNNPEQALKNGYGGRPFHLAREEQDLVLSIRAKDLSDFAMQLVEYRNNGKKGNHQKNGKNNGHGNGSGHWFSSQKAMVLMETK